MNKFFLGPNFRDKLNMGAVNPINFPYSTPEEVIAQEQAQEQIIEETKKTKGKQDGKES